MSGDPGTKTHRPTGGCICPGPRSHPDETPHPRGRRVLVGCCARGPQRALPPPSLRFALSPLIAHQAIHAKGPVSSTFRPRGGRDRDRNHRPSTHSDADRNLTWNLSWFGPPIWSPLPLLLGRLPATFAGGGSSPGPVGPWDGRVTGPPSLRSPVIQRRVGGSEGGGRSPVSPERFHPEMLSMDPLFEFPRPE